MSLGYAQKLSYKEDVGSVGMKELYDPPNILQQKIEQLASMVAESKHLVVFTGAGISTSCGIPDFRGPKGVWTLQVFSVSSSSFMFLYVLSFPCYIDRVEILMSDLQFTFFKHSQLY
ncbi:hypothetical protein Leryth_024029 [Lithospermum erythrorhizon]|nr:hypothetical protein Leryth_024029 [Lithospermum erythrorhizon]